MERDETLTRVPESWEEVDRRFWDAYRGLWSTKMISKNNLTAAATEAVATYLVCGDMGSGHVRRLVERLEKLHAQM